MALGGLRGAILRSCDFAQSRRGITLLGVCICPALAGDRLGIERRFPGVVQSVVRISASPDLVSVRRNRTAVTTQRSVLVVDRRHVLAKPPSADLSLFANHHRLRHRRLTFLHS